MRYEIKQLNDTDAIVISNKEIEKGDWCINDFDFDNNFIFKADTSFFKSGLEADKIIATISPFKIEGLPMLELPSQEEDVEDILNVCEEQVNLASKKAYTTVEANPRDTLNKLTAIKKFKNTCNIGVLIGYKAAQKQYSEEDMRKAIEMAREADSLDGTVDLHIVLNYPNADNSDLRIKWTEEEIIQSLQKKQFPIAVELTEDLKVIKCHYKK